MFGRIEMILYWCVQIYQSRQCLYYIKPTSGLTNLDYVFTATNQHSNWLIWTIFFTASDHLFDNHHTISSMEDSHIDLKLDISETIVKFLDFSKNFTTNKKFSS